MFNDTFVGTLNFGLRYKISSNYKLIFYTDNDWDGCIDDKHYRLCTRSWVSNDIMGFEKAAIHNTSTIEVEYMVATSASCQIVWVRRMLSDLKEKQEEATILLCDNKSTIELTNNPVFHGRTKHIEVRHHFI